MALTRTERLILSNQLRILEVLYPDEAPSMVRDREALECGYELHYESAMQHVYENTLSLNDCEEIIDILDMFDVLKTARQRLGEIPDVDDWEITYAGFDGNNELPRLAYARWYSASPGCRFAELDPGMNSHMRTLDRYRRQLVEWENAADKYNLTAEDITRIAHAAIPPENR